MAVHPLSAAAPDRVPVTARRRRAVEVLLALAVFAGSAWWGTIYWNASLKAGRQPNFYQAYFEPAVMMACGKGFVIAQPQVPAMTPFLLRQVDTFSCSQIPADATLGTKGLYQGVWRYLLVTTAIGWWLLGISWSGMGPLFGVFFAATITIGYFILRLGTGRVMALVGVVGLSVSSLHLLNLPHLRDYSKAPFTLALVLIAGILVKARPTPRAILGCAVAYGLVLGIGYGFRTDFLVNIPFFFLVLFLFVDGGVLQHLSLKAAAAAVCLAMFIGTAWPIVSAVYRSGGCQWHTALLGLSPDFTDALELADAPYDWGAPYLDTRVYDTAVAYARRVSPGIGHVEFCAHEYDVVTGRYLMEIATRFPGDMLARAYASAFQVTNLAMPWTTPPLPDLAPRFYVAREHVLASLKGAATIATVIALVMVSTASVRLALFLGFFLVYFGGYPAIQFANRHFFHLEIISWWAFGFVAHHSARALMARSSRGAGEGVAPPNWRQAAWLLPLMAGCAVLPLLLLRGYQQLTLRAFFDRYVTAPMDPIAMSPGAPGALHPVPAWPAADPETGEQFLAVTINAWQCGDRPSVTLRYDKAFPAMNYTRTFTLAPRSLRTEPTQIFTPVYKHFLGVEFSDIHPGCVGTVSRVTNIGQMSLLLPAVLPPRWQHQSLYQTIKGWPTAR